MAQFDFEIQTSFFTQLGNLSEVERFAPKMIEEAIPILTEEVKRSLEKHSATGVMVKSIKATKVGCKNGVYYAVVRPTGVSTKYKGKNGKMYLRSKAVRNMEIVAHIEYGTSTQQATPFLSKAYKDAEPAVLKKMSDVFTREAFGGGAPW